MVRRLHARAAGKSRCAPLGCGQYGSGKSGEDALKARIDQRRSRLIIVAATGIFVQRMRSAILLTTLPSAS
jgi:hypothetical protein